MVWMQVRPVRVLQCMYKVCENCGGMLANVISRGGVKVQQILREHRKQNTE